MELFNNLASGLETKRGEIASLSSRLSTLDLHVDEIDRRDTTKDAQLEHEISQNEQRINGIQSDSARMSNLINKLTLIKDSLLPFTLTSYMLYCDPGCDKLYHHNNIRLLVAS